LNKHRKSDLCILSAAAISFVLSAYLWFTGQYQQGLFTALWVPTILLFGLYFRVMLGGARK
jgi:hypothetical protein